MSVRHYNPDSRRFLYYGAIKALEIGGNFGRESKRTVPELFTLRGKRIL